jgi:hypothetical protein
MRSEKKLFGVALAAALALGSLAERTVGAADAFDGKAAFETMKSLAGTWEGSIMTKDGPPATVTYELTSNKTVVMETLFGGTDHEMRSLYHMDRNDLVISHYCAVGNQPRMRLAKTSTASELVFDFDGGMNLDPAKDMHVHSGRVRLVDADHIETEWTAYQGGKQVGAHKFFLTRKH